MNTLISLDENASQEALLNQIKAALLSASPASLSTLFPDVAPQPSSEDEINQALNAGQAVESTIAAEDAEAILQELGMGGELRFDDIEGFFA